MGNIFSTKLNGYKELQKDLFVLKCTLFLKNPGRHKKTSMVSKNFWGGIRRVKKGQKKFYQLLRTRFRKIQDLRKGFEFLNYFFSRKSFRVVNYFLSSF